MRIMRYAVVIVKTTMKQIISYCIGVIMSTLYHYIAYKL